MSKLKKTILSGLLLGILIVFDRFISIKYLYLQITFDFIPIILAAILLGPKYSMLIAALGDLIGALLFPFGEYFVGFTIIDGIVGLIYGLFLYKPNKTNIISKQNSTIDKDIENNSENNSNTKFYQKKSLLIRLCISSAIVLWIIELPGMSFMLSLLYGRAFLVILSERLMVKLIMFPTQIIVIYFLSDYIEPLSEKYLYTDEF